MTVQNSFYLRRNYDSQFRDHMLYIRLANPLYQYLPASDGTTLAALNFDEIGWELVAVLFSDLHHR